MFENLVETVVIKNSKVLLVKEDNSLLNLPAGHLEQGETIAEGAKREFLEETRYAVNLKDFVQSICFENKGKNYVSFIFRGDLLDCKKRYGELDWDFYDIEYIKNNKHLLRNDKLIICAIDNCLKEKDNVEKFNFKI